jgi:hypothetical protein
MSLPESIKASKTGLGLRERLRSWGLPGVANAINTVLVRETNTHLTEAEARELQSLKAMPLRKRYVNPPNHSNIKLGNYDETLTTYGEQYGIIINYFMMNGKIHHLDKDRMCRRFISEGASRIMDGTRAEYDPEIMMRIYMLSGGPRSLAKAFGGRHRSRRNRSNRNRTRRH